MAKKKQRIGEVMCRGYWRDQYELEECLKSGSCFPWKKGGDGYETEK